MKIVETRSAKDIYKVARGQIIPKFSIIIPALNEGGCIGDTLACLRHQTFTNYEIIVSIDPATTDDTCKLAEKYGCKVVFSPISGVCPTRDEGAKHAEGEILIYTDADTRLPVDWLEKINREFKDEELAALTGATMPFDGDVIIKMEYIARNLMRFLLSFIKVFPAPGYLIAIRRDIFYQIGGYSHGPSHPYLDRGHHGDGLSPALLDLGKTKFSFSIWAFPSARRYKKIGFIKFNLYYSYVLDRLFGRKLPSWWISLQKYVRKFMRGMRPGVR